MPNKQFDFDFTKNLQPMSSKEVETVEDIAKKYFPIAENQVGKARHFQSQDLSKKPTGNPDTETTKGASSAQRQSVFAYRQRRNEPQNSPYSEQKALRPADRSRFNLKRYSEFEDRQKSQESRRNDESSLGPKSSQQGDTEPRAEAHQASAQQIKVKDIHFRSELEPSHGDVIQDLTATLARSRQSKGKRFLSIDKQISRQLSSLNSMKMRQVDAVTSRQLDQIAHILE